LEQQNSGSKTTEHRFTKKSRAKTTKKVRDQVDLAANNFRLRE
jgi:hypothetical protein